MAEEKHYSANEIAARVKFTFNNWKGRSPICYRRSNNDRARQRGREIFDRKRPLTTFIISWGISHLSQPRYT